MTTAKPKQTIWLVTDADTHGGCCVRAVTPEEAFRKAVRKWIKNAKRVKVASFAGQAHVSRHWFNVH